MHSNSRTVQRNAINRNDINMDTFRRKECKQIPFLVFVVLHASSRNREEEKERRIHRLSVEKKKFISFFFVPFFMKLNK